MILHFSGNSSGITKSFIVTSCFSFLAIFANGQAIKPHSTDNKLKNIIDSAVHQVASAYMSSKNAVGLSIGIYKNGKQYTYHYGETKKEKRLPQDKSYYDIGSLAKVFVATMLARAVVDGKVHLTDDIRRYLPAGYSNLAYQGHPIRLVDLANHTSGLPELSRDYYESTIDSVLKLSSAGLKNFYEIYTSDSLLHDMHHFTVDTIPGTKYRYNGNAMNVLLLLQERIYEAPFETVLKHFLRERFGMYNTHLGLTPKERKQLIQGYDEKGAPEPYVNFQGFRAAPGLNSTTSDMLKFIRANIEETDPAIRLTHEPTFKRSDSSWMALGWMIEKKNDGSRMIYHSGRGSGITTLCTVHPEKQIGFIIFVNNGSGERRLYEMEDMLMEKIGTH
jgi:CubicO group peptidase (beta-lactamase class C family)